MKNKIALVTLVLLLLMPAFLQAKPVNPHKAHLVADHFFKAIGQKQRALQDITSRTPYTQFYIFAAPQGEGFVLVAADDCVVPILGYSTKGTFATEAMPAHVKGWLNDYEKQILFYRNHTSSPTPIQANPKEDPIAQQWALLLSDNPSIPPLNTAIAPLLSTTWGQDPYYNIYCPYNASTGENSPTGCVATAIAQVMKFWGHPTTGYGSHSYTPSSYPTQSANFGTTTYNWSLMPDALTSSSTTAEINEVATLMHHLGVALEMQYDVDVSNAYVYYQGDHTQASADNVLRNYFKYKPSLHQINIEDYTPASWSATLTSELAAGRPIIYSGSDPTGGHCFVCDGCDNSGLFHINWGWRGYCDGYYAIGHLNPTSGGTGGNSTYTFNLYNVAVIGIEPNNSFGSTTTVTVSSNNTAYGTAAGGGTFSGTNTQTVSLTATAAAGCRFTGWSDGYQFNPRSFYANGGNYSFVANFQPLSGDTLGYCQNYYIFGLRNTSGVTKWGIKLPASVLTPNHDLTHISFYAVAAGNHTLTIYTGTSSPSTTAHTQTVYIPDSAVGSWHTIPLSSPVAIDGSRSVWIAFSYTGSSSIYPAAMSYYSGNRDGILWGSNLSPLTTWDYSFMIRGIFTDNTPPPPLGDTVSYCDDNPYVTSIGASGSGNIHWGIRLPSSMHQHRNYLTDVMVYVVEGVPHTLNIYQGNTTSSATLVASQSVNFSSSNVNSWHTIPIPNGVALNPNQPLWITFNATANLYPAATCAFNGDSNSSLISLNGSDWSSLATATGNSLNGSWMIRAILSLTPPAASVVITGPTEIGQDVPNTFSAAGPAGATYSWTLTGAIPATASGSTITATWHTPGTYNVIVAATTPSATVYDTLTVTVQSCHVSSFPYTMGAEPTDNLNCWSFIDNDNDGHGWSTSFCPPDSAHSGSFAFTSASYINDIGALHPDNWLVSPAIPITPGFTYSLTWFDRAFDINYPSDYYSVYISTTGNNVSDFTSTPLFQTTITSNNYTQRTLNLSSYAGQTVYLAFRHHNCSDQYCMILDDITISRTPIPTYTLTVLSANSTMGTVSGGGTYYAGTSATISATPNIGYHFVQWNDGDTHATRTVTVNANATYTASFETDTIYYTLTVLSANPAMGTVSGSGTYPEGTNVTITASAFTGYHFLYWNDGNHDTIRTVTVNADATYTATFEANPPESIDNVSIHFTISLFANGQIFVEGATGHPIVVYDLMGRQIARVPAAKFTELLCLPHRGVYLVKVSTLPVQKIINM
ncbi:MAG: C10 family peptidase [Bacteroidales bacterium]|nr:C10 family peptidase [Bacteroidales bacterium]